MQIGSLFSGIGGFDLAARWMGWTTKWYSEIDPYACRVMEARFGEGMGDTASARCREGRPEQSGTLRDEARWAEPQRRGGARNVGDITRWHPTEQDAVDIVCGGFPCQPVSLAGKRKAQDDERWLWPEFARVLGVLRPRYVVIENVPGLRSRGMDDVLRDLAKIRYDAEWTSLSAADVGAPHKRERVWILAYPQHTERRAVGETRHPTGQDVHPQRKQSPVRVGSSGEVVADPSGDGRQPGDRWRTLPNQDGDGTSSVRKPQQQPGTGDNSAVADPGIEQRDWRMCRAGWWNREPQETLRLTGRGRWEEDGVSIPESLLGRVVDGVPSRVDRLRCLGNAIVPQCAYEIFKCIESYEGT